MDNCCAVNKLGSTYFVFMYLLKRCSNVQGWVNDEVPSDVTDFSKYSKPVGKLFGSLPLNDPKAFSKQLLPQHKVQEYWQNGFVTNIPVLSHEQCDLLLQDLALLSVHAFSIVSSLK